MAYIHYYLDSKTSPKAQFRPRLLYTGTVADDPHWFNIEHTHDFFEVLYVVKGTGTAVLDHTPFELHSGDLVLINPGVLHEERSAEDAPLNLIFLGTEGFCLGGCPPNCLLQPGEPPVFSSGIHRSAVERYFSDLLRETSSQVEYYEEVSQALLAALLLFLLRIRMADPQSHAPDGECERVKAYINENYTKPLTLESLSQSVYISKYHLAHLFKSQTGVSPIKYLITRRMEEAQHLLRETDLPIRAIAEKVGYDDPAYFSQIFKKTVGSSPLSYRNSK